MSTYKDLPGVNLELLDGNLRIDETITGNSLLVIGLAETGTTGTQYYNADSNKTANIYGAESPIIKRMEQGRLGGAQNIVLYRIGGKSARINDIFGEGSYIETIEQSVTAGSKFKVYIGERPTKDGKACLIVFRNDKIVYSNVPGSEIDLHVVDVSGFDPETKVRIGTPTEPVLLEEVVIAPEEKTQTVADASGTEFELQDTKRAYEVTVKTVKVAGQEVAKEFVSVQDHETKDAKKLVFSSGNPTSQELEVVYEVTKVRSQEGSAVFTGDSSQTDSFELKNTKTTDKVFLKSVQVAGEDKLSEATIEDKGSAKALKLQTAPEDQASVIVEYTVYSAGDSAPGTYTPGENNIGCSWKKYYELLHAALADLDVINSFSVVTDRAIIDAPNIAYGSKESDRLDYVRVEEVDGELKFEWSENKVLYKKGGEMTTSIEEADLDGNGQPIIAKYFNEANFGHLLANFAHNVSENERFCLVTIGTSTPAKISNYDIAKWLGTPAVYDAVGNIIENGTGLLGLRGMTERAEFRQGFYKTDTGFIDGNVQVDSNGAPIDIGKYLSVVPAIANTGVSAAIGTDGRNTNAAAIYAGLLTTINPGDSTTNVVIPRISVPFQVKKTKLDQLAHAGYVMLQDKARGVTVVSGELATNINSDYDYVSTSIIISDVIQTIREVADPYIGRGLNEATTAALNTAIESALQLKVTNGSIVKYGFSVITNRTVNGKGSLTVQLTIVPAFELREINVAAKLALDI